jgi:hypothetical protein
MAAANAYRAKTCTYKSTAVLGITDVSITVSGNQTDLATDASATVTAVFVDSIAVDVTVTTTDLARVTALQSGDTGSLVIVFQLRAEGSGAGAGDKTATLATATVVNYNPQAGTNGIGSFAINFRCSGPAGTTPLVWS